MHSNDIQMQQVRQGERIIMGDGMKKYKASDLSHKRAEVMKEARDGGVIIQECRTNGEVICEYYLITGNSIEHLMIEGVDGKVYKLRCVGYEVSL